MAVKGVDVPLQPFKIDQFGGLNLRDDPAEFGTAAAVDMLNVDLDRRGRLRTRDGYAALTNISGTLANDITAIFAHGDELVVTSYNQIGTTDFDLYVIDSSGALVTSLSYLVATGVKVTSGAVSFGTATSSRLYIPVWTTSGNLDLLYYDGAAFGAGTGKPGFVAAVGGGGAIRATGTNLAPRLAQGHYTTAADDPTSDNIGTRSTVFFSDPGDPQTYTAGNWVHLRPGDSEEITAMVSFDGRLYVFKQSAVFIFTHEGLDPTGAPVFYYSELSLPVPLSLATGTGRRCAVAGEDGVYYSTVSGVYRVTGGAPALVSGAIPEIFGVDSEFSSLRFDGDPATLSWANGRLFATYVLTGGGSRTLVYDPRADYWTLWSNVGTTGYFATFPPLAFSASPGTADFQERLLFPLGQDVYYTDPDLTTDAGTAIASAYQSGWYEMSEPGADVFTRWSRLWGSGSPTVSVFTDHGSSDANAGAVTLGTAPAIAEGYHLKNYKGKLFSHKISAASGAWVVNRLQHDVAWVRP